MIGNNILYYEKVSSTNSLAAEMLDAGKVSHGTVISAAYQYAGRGQRNNTWSSEAHKNLIISIILKPECFDASKQFDLSRITSLALVRTLSTFAGGFSIKWPNDIYHEGDKIAGILIENSITGDKISSSLIGIGLNINQEEFPAELPNPVSLKIITGQSHLADELLNILLEHMNCLYDMLMEDKNQEIANAYSDNLYLSGRELMFTDSRGPFLGTIDGVNSFGQLLVSTSGGEKREYSFKEISFPSV